MKKFTIIKALVLFTGFLFITSQTAYAQYNGSGTFQQITSLEDMESGTYYVFYGINDSYTGAMTNTISGGRMGNSDMPVSSGNIIDPSESIVWLVEGNSTDGFTVYNEAENKYCEITDNSTSGFSFTEISSHTYNVTVSENEFVFASNHPDGGNRAISIYQTDWRPYVTPNTLHLFKLTEVEDPLLTVSPTSVSGLNYIEGEGPSASQPFELSGMNLDGSDVTITAPTNFEISLDNTSFSNSETVNVTNGSLSETVFVRLKENLGIANYGGDISIVGGGAGETTVALNGEVFELVFLIYEFTGEAVTPTQQPSDATTSDFQISAGSVNFGTTGTWGGSGTPYAQGSGGWGVKNASDAKHFFYTINPDTGYGINLSNISFEWRTTGAGPSAITVEINGTEVTTFNSGSNAQDVFNSSLTGLNNLQSVEVKIKGWDDESRSTSGGGDFRINDVRLDGEVVESDIGLEQPFLTITSGTYFNSQTIFVDNFDDYAATVGLYFTVNGQDPDSESLEYNESEGIFLEDGNGPVTLKVIAIDGEDQSEITTAIYTFPINVDNIESLRNQVNGSTLYRVTNEATFIGGTDFRNTKFFQDDSGFGIQIDDPDQIIETSYSIGDNVAELIGTLGSFQGQLQLTPLVDPEGPESTGNEITPLLRTLEALVFGDQSRLVLIQDVEFEDADGTTTFGGGGYTTNITDPSLTDYTGLFRNIFGDSDITGSIIPGNKVNITGIVQQNNDGFNLGARNLNDFDVDEPDEPTLIASPSTITELDYIEGEGPSASQLFKLSGQNLDGTDVVITAPVNFEVSEEESSGFGSEITLAAYDGTETDIWVRLAADLGIDEYSGDITITGGGSDPVTAGLTGSVIEEPTTELPFVTNFGIEDNWTDLEPTGWSGYNPKSYEESGWYFHSTETVRGTSVESFDGSAYSFRDRDVFTVANIAPVSGMTGFSVQLRDWMVGGLDRDLKISFDGGDTWETLTTINKAWFDEYQVYQQFVHYFEEEKDFEANDFTIQIVGGNSSNDGRINIGQFEALDTDPDTPMLSASPASVEELNYVEDEGPSEAKSFELSGCNLDGTDVVITAPANFEVSEEESSGFGSEITLAAYDGTETDIWVRLAADLAIDNYSGNIEISGGGAETLSVSVTGEVTEPADLFAIPYENPFRSQEDVDYAITQGFNIYDYDIHETTDPYFRFVKVGSYIESPLIDFTLFESLEFIFDTRNYGTGTGRELSLMLSVDGGDNYSVVETIPVSTTTFETQELIIDLTNLSDGSEGRFKIEMTAGTGSIRFRDLSVTEFIIPDLATPEFSHPEGIYYEDFTVKITNYDDYNETVSFYYTLNGLDPDKDSDVYDDAEGILIEFSSGDINLKAIAIDDNTDEFSFINSVIYTFPEDVDDILTLRGKETDGTVYRLTGEAILTYQSSTRNQKFIQDATAGILIDDAGGIIETSYNRYDGIENLTGSLSVYREMLQFVPVTDPGPASSDGNEIVPEVRTLADLDSEDQGKLVYIGRVEFSSSGGFINARNYNITDPSGSGIFRTHFSDADYLGTQIPTQLQNLTALVHQFDEDIQVTARGLDDFDPISDDATLALFKINEIDVLDLPDIIVANPDDEAQAVLFVESFDEFSGIKAETNHESASFEVFINGQEIDKAALPGAELSDQDVILVSVTAEDDSRMHYKLKTKLDLRDITFLRPEEGDIFVSFQVLRVRWEAEAMEELLLEKINKETGKAEISRTIEEGETEWVMTVPNGMHGHFKFRLTDTRDQSFYAETGYFRIIDYMPPTLVSKSPASGSTGLDPEINLRMTFYQEQIYPGEGSIYVYKKGEEEPIKKIEADSDMVEYDYNIVNILTKGLFDFQQSYYILIDKGAFVDLAGNEYAGILDETFWAFSTEMFTLVCNGDFEAWSAGVPVCWYGDRSNINRNNVNRFETDSQTGRYSAQLVNTGSGHQRFTTEPTILEEGISYRITFWVKGKGDIRTGLFDARETGFGYAPYNDYILVESDTWTEYSQIVTAANSTNEAEFIFSLRNTSAGKNHLLLDNVSVEEITEEETGVNTIAELRQGTTGGKYILSGEAIITFQQDYRNQKYIQDETAAILIDDNNGVITTTYERYDGITGISGTLASFNNMLQFIPDQDTGPATSSGNEVIPLTMTLGSIGPDHQAMLVEVEDVNFEESGNFVQAQNYTISTPDGEGVFRTHFQDADYIGEPLPEEPLNIIVLVNQYQETIQLTARDLNDFGTLSSNARLALFTVGGEDVLGLSGLEVGDPEVDPGAELFVSDLTDFAGIEAETEHPMAQYTLTLNGEELSGEQMPSVDLYADDVIVATVVAENQTTHRYYKLTIVEGEEPFELICNGDFEYWTDGLPDCWYGVRSNITQSNVIRHQEDAFTGSYSAQLVNTGSGHQRFTTEPTVLEEGVSYVITFMVKGKGDIRTGLYDARETGFGYAPYNDYILIDSDTWTEYSQIVTAANTSDEAEFIFSLRNTDEEAGHLLLDHVRVEKYTDEATEVSTIAELREGTVGGQYLLTGEAVLTFRQDYRNQMYIQDETAAILIDDNDGVITTTYERYDGITGISGTLSSYNNMLQFIPDKDTGPATSSGNEVVPQTMSVVSIDFDDQARLIELEEVVFEESGVFETSQNYTITTPEGEGVFRTNFHDADYIGTDIPDNPVRLVVLVNQHNEYIQITARDLGDFEEIYVEERMLAVISPAGGDVFNTGDEVIFEWESENIEDLIFEFYLEGSVHISETIDAASGQWIYLLPDGVHGEAYYRLSDSEDAGFYEESGVFSLVDTQAPVLTDMQPSTGSTEVDVEAELLLEFDEDVFAKEGGLHIYQEDGTLFESVQAGSELISYDSNLLTVSISGTLSYGTDYYVLVDDNAFIDIAGNAFAGIQEADQWTFTTTPPVPVEVTDISGLRSGEAGVLYILTSEAVISFINAEPLNMYIQDEGAAILVVDNDNAVSSEYDIYDGITGLKGYLDINNGMVVFIPAEDPGAPSSTGNIIEPRERTLASLDEEDQAMLVMIKEVSFLVKSEVFESGISYQISSPDGDGIFHTYFYDADYIGEPIPEEPQNMAVLVHQHGEQIRVVSRSLDDFDTFVGIEALAAENVTIYPNPFAEYIFIEGSTQLKSITLINSSGQVVAEKMADPGLTVIRGSHLESGLYLLRLEFRDGSAATRTLIKP